MHGKPAILVSESSDSISKPIPVTWKSWGWQAGKAEAKALCPIVGSTPQTLGNYPWGSTKGFEVVSSVHETDRNLTTNRTPACGIDIC
jgi:hypothetical protein